MRNEQWVLPVCVLQIVLAAKMENAHVQVEKELACADQIATVANNHFSFYF